MKTSLLDWFLSAGIKIMAAALRVVINKRRVSPLNGPSLPSVEGKKNTAVIKSAQRTVDMEIITFLWTSYVSHISQFTGIWTQSSKNPLTEHYAYSLPRVALFLANTS